MCSWVFRPTKLESYYVTNSINSHLETLRFSSSSEPESSEGPWPRDTILLSRFIICKCWQLWQEAGHFNTINRWYFIRHGSDQDKKPSPDFKTLDFRVIFKNIKMFYCIQSLVPDLVFLRSWFLIRSLDFSAFRPLPSKLKLNDNVL